jgi:hypothetical protein
MPPKAKSSLSFAKSSVVPSFKLLFLELHLGTPVSPGQGIVFWWASELFATVPLDLGTATLSLVFVDEFGNIDPSAPLYSRVLTRSESQTVAQKSFTSDLIVVHPTEEVATRVYQVGIYRIRLVLSGTGQDGPYESGDVLLSVELPTVDRSWWEWTSALTRNENWKKSYILSGNFIDMTLSSVTASVTLREIAMDSVSPWSNVEDSETPIDNFMLSSPVGAGQNSAVTFKPITQNWKWYEDVVFVALPPNEKRFRYVVRLDITDQYKNAYPPVFLSDYYVEVDVKVADDKIAAQGLACTGMAAAGFCLIIAAAAAAIPTFYDLVIAAFWVGAAATTAAAAQVIGIAAADPPVKDPQYRSIYAPKAISFPDYDKAKPFLILMRAIFDVVALIESMNQTNSRLVGARAVHDRRAANLQERHFHAMSRKLGALGTKVQRATPIAARWLVEYRSSLSAAVLQDCSQLLTHDSKIRGSLQKDFLEAGGTASAFETLLGQVAKPEFGDYLSRAEPLIFGLGRYAEIVAKEGAKSNPVTEPASPPRRRRRS